MVGVVVPRTQQHQIGQVGAAAVDPVPHVMGLQPAGRTAARVRTPALAQQQRPEQRDPSAEIKRVVPPSSEERGELTSGELGTIHRWPSASAGFRRLDDLGDDE